MHEYQIRIFDIGGNPLLVAEEIHLRDRTAINAAHRQARGRPYEVWRGQDCIFRHALRRADDATLTMELWQRHLRETATHSVSALSAAIDALPLAVAIFDDMGRILSHSGAMRRILGRTIPSRDRREEAFWSLRDRDGSTLSPEDWPGQRALRGERNLQPYQGVYRNAHDVEARAIDVTAMSLSDGKGFRGGVTLLQDGGKPAETRFVQTLFEVLNAVIRKPGCADTRKALAAISGQA